MSSKEFFREFKELTTKFLFLNCNNASRGETYLADISTILNDLNSLDYEKNKMPSYDAALRLLESILNIPESEEIIIMKACCLMTVLISKQKISIPTDQFDSTIDWIVKCLNIKESEVRSELLTCISVLFKHHGNFTHKYFKNLLDVDRVLMKILNMAINPKSSKPQKGEETNEEILVNIFNCIDKILVFLTDETIDLTDSDMEVLNSLGSKMISVMYHSEILMNDSLQSSNFIAYSLSILQKVAQENAEWCEHNVGELLGIAKQFIHYGIVDTSNLRPQKVMPSQQPIIETSTNTPRFKGGKMPKTRKPRTAVKNKKSEKKVADFVDPLEGQKSKRIEPNVMFYKTSESDFSESETGRVQIERHRQAKIRLCAIFLIGALSKNVEKRMLFGYWHCLLPFDKPNIKELDSTSYDIFTCSTKDPNPKCRLAALQVISQLLNGSKIYLMQAENCEKGRSSFTPFSVTLGNTVVLMFEILTFALENESSLPVLTQVLKSLSVLVQATPFTRLKSGFVAPCIKQIRSLTNHKDPTIQVGALIVMEFFVLTSDITAEISESVGMPKTHTKILNNENKLNDSGAEQIIETEFYEESEANEIEISEEDKDIETSRTNSNTGLPWLLEKILDNLKSNQLQQAKNKKQVIALVSAPIRIESLQVLTALSSHILFIKDHLAVVAQALINSIQDEQNETRQHAAKCLDTLGHSINTFFLSSSNPSELSNCQHFWLSVLPCTIEKIQDSKQSTALKSILCDFLSNIGVHIFERLPHSQQMMLISLLTGISCNEENTVRASAVRALAVYVMYPSLRDDICFVENTATFIVELLKEKNSYVRIKSSWSLGNISDALIPLSNDNQLDRISDDLMQKMFDISNQLMNDNDKIKCNAVRTIGNLLRLIRFEHVQSATWRNLCLKSIEKLALCLTKNGNAKVKWNACYALGNFMKNEILFTNFDDFNWQAIVFKAVCDVIENNPNFKVRINGVTSLTVINNRNRYGQYFVQIWSALIVAMEQSDNLIDFNEYKHRDNLQEQICFALSHILKLATKDDLTQMNEALLNVELIKQIWRRVVNRIIPESATSLTHCSLYLEKLLQSPNQLSSEQRSAAKNLLHCFATPIEIF